MMTVTTSVMTNVTVMTVSSQSIASHMYSNQEHRSMQHGWLTTMYRTAAILEAMAVIAIRAASPILKTLNGMDMVWPLNCTPHKAVCAAVLRCWAHASRFRNPHQGVFASVGAHLWNSKPSVQSQQMVCINAVGTWLLLKSVRSDVFLSGKHCWDSQGGNCLLGIISNCIRQQWYWARVLLVTHAAIKYSQSNSNTPQQTCMSQAAVEQCKCVLYVWYHTLTKRASTSTRSNGIIQMDPVKEMKSPKNGSRHATKVDSTTYVPRTTNRIMKLYAEFGPSFFRDQIDSRDSKMQQA